MNFDRLAPFYQTMECLAAGRKLRRCREAFLGEIQEPQRVLSAGEGRGGFLRECLKRFPNAHFTVVDSSQAMLDFARMRLDHVDLKRVLFVHADLLDWSCDECFDLIATHFFLDCFEPETLAAIVNKLAGMAADDATWLLSDFQVANGRFAALRSRWILWLLYRFFRTFCKLEADSLTAPDPFLAEAGFRLVKRLEYDCGLLKSECWRR
jgi:cyclopropane fatty-acyl-phospholipid synthase-like methyltransferase